MKPIRSICSIICFMTVMQTTAQATGIKFTKESKWSKILAQAKKENKLIFLDAYASWCGPCKYLQSNVFTDAAVGKYYNQNFINVKMDMEEGEGIQLGEQLGVTAYPTLFFVNGDGEIVHKAVGAMEPEELVDLGMTASDPGKQFYTLKKLAANGKLDVKEFHNWIHDAVKLKEESIDSVINKFLLSSKTDLFNAEMLEIIFDHAETLPDSTVAQLYRNRKGIEVVLNFDAAEFDKKMLNKILIAAEAKSLTNGGNPDYQAYRKYVATYQPARANLETSKFKISRLKKSKEHKELLKELSFILSDKSIKLSASEFLYLMVGNTATIVENKGGATFLKLIENVVLAEDSKDKAYVKDVASLAIYAELKDKKKISELQGKLLTAPNVPEQIINWALSL
jgi:thiol-disulfide isomerase/thioredoxin